MKVRILDQKGQGLTEYITLLLLVSVCSIAAAKTLGTTIKRNIQQARDHIDKGLTVE
jgi:Flp pilus assembly pilin Flp